ncbi:YfjI family protein [Streptomyces sp. NBC_01198]|uniref:YfjI family protein n=1 Tax=Streptomyces sp. NBC_01198 TaxID=2903769 RepID=UPI002E15659A|nr:YfjI family protein [Streptomyces sp. NBC_01198]
MTAQPVDSPEDLWAAFPAVDAPDTVSADAPWDDPVPLKQRRELPDFPTTALPGWLRDFTTAVAEETQTPVDLAGCVALAVLATAAGGRAVVHVRGRWREPTNLFTVCALPPGNRKSAVFAAMTDPLYEAEKQLKERAAPAIIEATLTSKLAREAADKAATKASSASGTSRDALISEAVGMAQQADTLAIPAEPQLLADDATAETITSLMADQGGRIAVMSAEGEIFDIIAGRYSGAPNMGPFLKGHAGDRLRVNRQTRREYIDHPALTMGLSVQPTVLDDIGRIKGAKGKGLLGRFLYSLPESTLGYRKTLPDPVPDAVAAVYERNVIALTLAMADWTDPAVLQLTPEADVAVQRFQDRMEPKLNPRGGSMTHISDWASKLHGAAVRIAGLLHLAEHLDRGHSQPVTADTMAAAITLADYFAGHALAVFDRMGANETAERARAVLDALKANLWPEVSKRDLMVKLSRSDFPTAADLDGPLSLLEDHGYLRPLPVVRTGTRGRPPSPRYLVHPYLTDPEA